MSEGEPEVIEQPDALAPPPAEVVEQPETTEETAEAEQPEAAKEEQETEEEPKRESGYKRMKRRALIAEAQLANARLKEVGTKAATDDKAPKEEDFNGDWGKYIAATAAHEAAKAVKGSLAEDRQAAEQDRAAKLNQEVLADFEERTEAFKTKAKDFDDVVSGYVAKGGKFSDAVRELVMDSDVGPQLTYHLAKNPVIANKLNALSPLQAAKEIARLEDSLSKPSTKATSAVPPVKAPKGGSTGNFDPNTASMEEYIAKRNAGWNG